MKKKKTLIIVGIILILWTLLIVTDYYRLLGGDRLTNKPLVCIYEYRTEEGWTNMIGLGYLYARSPRTASCPMCDDIVCVTHFKLFYLIQLW